MATPAEPSIWMTLVPVIVGGVIGLAGGLIGPWLLESRKQEAEKKKKRAEKLEELGSAIYELSHWLEIKRNRLAFGESAVETVSPLFKAQAISAVYFPEFVQSVDELETIILRYEVWMAQAASKRIKNDPNYNEGMEAIHLEYITKSRDLQNEVQAVGRTLFE